MSDQFQLLDLAGPCAAFQIAQRQLGVATYRMLNISARGGIVRNSLGMLCDTEPLANHPLNTVMVMGGTMGTPPEPPELSNFLIAAATCQRIASVCTGAFVLAAAGLLDGRRATTHWRFAAQLQRDYPRVRVEADRIFCRDAHFWTSAGITAGIDLSLALIEQDHGLALAQQVARDLVVSHRRLGGQSQFASSVDSVATNNRLAAALGYARDHLSRQFTVEQMAEAAGLSLRQFSRAFRLETGTTPARVVERMRADVARGHIEAGTESIEQIARVVGFGDAERMRRAFIRVFGQPPQAVRRTARTND